MPHMSLGILLILGNRMKVQFRGRPTREVYVKCPGPIFQKGSGATRRIGNSTTAQILDSLSVSNGDLISLGNCERNAVKPRARRTARVGASESLRLSEVPTTEKVDECQAVFIVRSQSFLLDDVLDLIDKHGSLVITEAKGMLQHGSAINMIKEGDKESFEVNMEALNKQGLKIPDNLLVLAVNVDVGPKF